MKLSFHGADRGVTGSCHMLECAGRRVLIDCGLFQGGRALEEENAEPFGFEPAEIDLVLLTHAHLDHCGRLPLLAKRGFRGEIVTTSASRELARLVMLDAAHLHEEDARHAARHAARAGHRASHHGKHNEHHGAPSFASNEPGFEPLYTILDAMSTFERFGRTAVYGEPLELAPGLRATFIDAGHILGSASVRLDVQEGGVSKSVLFSGDLGNPGRPLLRDPATPPETEVVVIETTYGDRPHQPVESSVDELYEAISETGQRGGNVIIPTFALERAQELLYFLQLAVKQGRLPSSLQVFLDSPMAISATQIFEHHPECYEEDVAELFREGRDPFRIPGLRFTRETTDSIALNDIRSGAVLMAGSGMCTGGRVKHHLRHNLGRAESSVVFVGYAAEGTLARRIIDGARKVRIYGEEVPVRARIHTINGFSAHADQAQLLAWHGETRARRTFLVHGEERSMHGFAKLLHDTQVEMPELHQSFEL